MIFHKPRVEPRTAALSRKSRIAKLSHISPVQTLIVTGGGGKEIGITEQFRYRYGSLETALSALQHRPYGTHIALNSALALSIRSRPAHKFGELCWYPRPTPFASHCQAF